MHDWLFRMHCLVDSESLSTEVTDQAGELHAGQQLGSEADIELSAPNSLARSLRDVT